MAERTLILCLLACTILPSWLRAEVLYPYSTDRETIRDISRYAQVNLPKAIPVFGRKYSEFWISNNGYITVSESGTKWQAIEWKKQEGSQFTEGTDPIFIAPYYARTEPLKTSQPGHVYYQQGNGDSLFVKEASADLQSSVVTDVTNFRPTSGLMVTWLGLTFSGGFPTAAKSNTFQMVLLSDGSRTFTVFNYLNTSWTGGVSAGGDMKTGLGATQPPAQAGFNLGEGRGWVSLPYSGSEQIVNLDRSQGSNTRGRFVYMIHSTVSRGSCTPKDSNDKKLMISLLGGSMYGGEDLYVSGPCLNVDNPPQVYCRFAGKKVVKGEIYSASKVRCVPPPLFQRDHVSIEMSADGGINWPYQTTYNVVLRMLNPTVITENVGDWATLDPTTLKLSWQQGSLECNNVEVWLVGYKEDQAGVPSWKRLDKLGVSGINNGAFTFDVGDNRCRSKETCSYEIGLVEVACRHASPSNPRRLHTKIIPLGWYVNEDMSKNNGKNWAEGKCTAFYENDGRQTQWLESLPGCPCSLHQARADFGRWTADPSCNIDDGSVCFFHTGAVHCVRSITPSADGAGNQCCYTKDGSLMYSLDTNQGSTPDKGFHSGAPPFGLGPRVPDYSHWLEDVITFFYCCTWTEGHCNYYMDRRPTRECVDYVTPRAATAYGDPHFATFDSTSYTFNGVGEFWLMKAEDMHVQARFEPAESDEFDHVNATIMTSLAVQALLQSDIVEVRLNPQSERWKDDVTVLINKKPVMFEHPDMKSQQFQGVSVTRNHNKLKGPGSSNFTIVFPNGVGVMVTAVNSLLQTIIVVPPEFKGKTRGLFGTWDDSKENDFSSNTDQVYLNASSEYIHNYFGWSWQVDKAESLFTYTISNQYETYQDRDYQVHYEMPPHPINSTFTEKDVDDLCMGNLPCMYDYRATGNADIARSSLLVSQLYERQRTALETDYRSCGVLPVKNAKKDRYSYFLGDKVKVTGCHEGYTFSGATDYECIEKPDKTVAWDREVTATCKGKQSSKPTKSCDPCS